MHPDDLLVQHLRLNLAQRKTLERLNLATVRDLLAYFPNRYGQNLPIKTIAELAVGDQVTVYGQVTDSKISKAWKKKIPLGEITIEDQTGRIKAIWFHQAFLAKKVAVGLPARLQGKVAERKGILYLANPEIERADALGGSDSLFGQEVDPTTYLLPIYPEVRGLSSSWFHHNIQKLLKSGVQEELPDIIPAEIIKKYNLPTLATALIWIHSPKTDKDATAARKRFAFQEIFLIQLSRLRAKLEYAKHNAFRVQAKESEVGEFIKRFPFQATVAQERAVKQILADIGADKPMTRLLEGDVGSGKTAVAATTAFAVVKSGLEVAYMAPTEILARQHFESFIRYFKHLPNMQVGLITGNGCYKFPSKINPSGYTDISRPQLLKWVANGEIPILVGTHALIQKTVKFKNLAYVIIDEQHRFGVMQRAKLTRKDSVRVPHLLSMTATPIPRTLALTIYGDLDLTLLDEMPAGRKTIITEIVTEDKRAKAYEHIRQELKAGRQAYIICPRIDEPDPTKELALITKSAKAEQKRLQDNIFPEFTAGLVHSKLKPKDKEEVMAEFAAGKIDILVATSVVEVGVNVPNATIIVIEGAERFGLSQLHQLRGRVWRSNHQAYCYLFSDSKGTKTVERLRAIKTAKNGFELAELDLGLRGAGSLVGGKQWGLSDVGMEAIKNLKMVEAARAEAQAMLKADPELKNYPLLHEKLHSQTQEIHFE